MNLLSAAEKSLFDDALMSVFQTFARPLTVYVAAQQATISTSPTYSRFGQHDQNAAITAQNPAVTPQSYVISGCILYGNKQPWDYVEMGGRRDYQQDKIRESFGTLRLKVDASGYAVMQGVKLVNLDGFNFTLNSNARPHGLVGTPTRYTYTLQKID